MGTLLRVVLEHTPNTLVQAEVLGEMQIAQLFLFAFFGVPP